MTTLAPAIGSHEPYSNPGISRDALLLTDFMDGILHELRNNAILENKYAVLDGAYRDASVEDWDGHGAAPADPYSYHLAKEILSQLPDRIPTPEITVDPDGELSFEWYNSKKRLIILSVGGDDALNYVGVIGRNREKGVEYFDGEIPERILVLFKRIFG